MWRSARWIASTRAGGRLHPSRRMRGLRCLRTRLPRRSDLLRRRPARRSAALSTGQCSVLLRHPARSGRAARITGRSRQNRPARRRHTAGSQPAQTESSGSVSTIVRPSEKSPGRRPDVLRVLKAAAGPMSITAVADKLGVHPNTVRFHLDTLVSDGQVEQVEPDRKRPGRPPQMFRALRQMDPDGPRHYRLLAEILATSLADGRESTCQGAGRRPCMGAGAWNRKRRKEKKLHHKTIDRPPRRGTGRLGFAPEHREIRWGAADWLAALPIPRTRRNPNRCRLPDPPGPDAGSSGKLSGTGRRRSTGCVRRTGSMSGPPHVGGSQ